MSRKLILPNEIQVCATCSYWDGDRKVDAEVGVVVVDDNCKGECLVRETPLPALRPKGHDVDCAWEHLEGEEADGAAEPAAEDVPPAGGEKAA